MPRPIHKGLTPDRILDAASAIIDTDGVDALTMRRLGADLGVAAMALYNHFADRDALLNALAERTLQHLLTAAKPAASPPAWRARIRRLVTSVHALADQHPRLFSMILDRPNRPRAFFPLMSESLDAFRQAGLSRKAAVQWYHTFLILIHGYASWRATLEHFARATPNPNDEGELTAAQIDDWRAVHTVSPKAQFDHAIDLLLNTLEAEAAASQAVKSKTK